MNYKTLLKGNEYTKIAIKITNIILYELVYGYNDIALLITMMASFSSFLIYIIYPGDVYYIIGNLSIYLLVRICQWTWYNISSDRCLSVCYSWFFIVIILTIILFPITYV